MKALLVVLIAIASAAGGIYSFRKPITQWAIKSYAKSLHLQIDLQVKTLDWNEILIENIHIENGIFIPKIHILRDSQSPQMGNIQSFVMHIESVDVLTAKNLMERFFLNKPSTASSKQILFSDLKIQCDQLFPTNIHIRIENLVHKNTTVPLVLEISHKTNENTSHFSFSGNKLDFSENKRFILKADAYSGKLHLKCSNNSIEVSGDPIALKITNLESEEPYLKIDNSLFVSKNASISVKNDNQVTVDFPLNIKVSAQTETQKIKGRLPYFLISGTYFLDNSQKSTLKAVAKNLNLSAPYTVTVQKILLDFFKSQTQNKDLGSTNLISTDFNGLLQLTDITYTPPLPTPRSKKATTKQPQNPQPLFRQVNSKIRFQKTKEHLKAIVDLTDATKNLAVHGLEITQASDATSLRFHKKNTQIRLNSQITNLFPIAKEHLKTISGHISARGLLFFTNGDLSGSFKVYGENISLTSGYGDITDLDWSHDVVSLKTFASSPHQKMHIHSLTAGKTIENISLDYQVMSLEQLRAQTLHMEYETALIDAENFLIYPLKKELIGFKATIKNLPLENILTLAVGPFVSATGTLSGNVNLEFEDSIPTVNGQLTSDQEGFILYRKQGDTQQKGLQFSDSPMSILNSYLYNFNYKTLDLDLRSNKKYQMNMLLGAYGHNPDYLKGKPLKLKINLEQNVLAAIQSMMLSYDLPSKLKERIEQNSGE